MTAKNRATGASTATPEAGITPQEHAKLVSAISEMSGFATDALAQIAGIARLALLAMEAPRAHTNTEAIGHAFTVIQGLALETHNLVGYAAEEAGCANDIDDAAMRRWMALADSRKVVVAA